MSQRERVRLQWRVAILRESDGRENLVGFYHYGTLRRLPGILMRPCASPPCCTRTCVVVPRLRRARSAIDLDQVGDEDAFDAQPGEAGMGDFNVAEVSIFER